MRAVRDNRRRGNEAPRDLLRASLREWRRSLEVPEDTAGYAILARPTAAPAHLLEADLDAEDALHRFRARVNAVVQDQNLSDLLRPGGGPLPPALDLISPYASHRADGVGFARPAAHRTTQREDSTADLDLELSADGTVRLICGRIAERRSPRFWSSDPDGTKAHPVLITRLLATHVRQVLQLAANTAHDTSYLGTWQVGALLEGTRGVLDWEAFDDITGHTTVTPYNRDDYYRAYTATRTELGVSAGTVSAALLRPLLRIIGGTGPCAGLLAP